MWQFWEATGVCRCWQQCCALLFECCEEVAVGLDLCLCILVAPLFGLCLIVGRMWGCTSNSFVDRARCCSEVVLLFSMWQGHDTKLVAVFGWLAWLADFHCRQVVSCRGFTWMLVCLTQKDIFIGKLLFLSVLAFVSPLYGKRPAQVEPVQLCKKQKTLKTGDASSTFPRLGVTEALKNARRCSGLEVKPQPQLSDDLGQAFPFVPQLFLQF